MLIALECGSPERTLVPSCLAEQHPTPVVAWRRRRPIQADCPITSGSPDPMALIGRAPSRSVPPSLVRGRGPSRANESVEVTFQYAGASGGASARQCGAVRSHHAKPQPEERIVDLVGTVLAAVFGRAERIGGISGRVTKGLLIRRMPNYERPFYGDCMEMCWPRPAVATMRWKVTAPRSR